MKSPSSKKNRSGRISARHRRTRKDHSTETAEDYVEAVAEIHAQRGSCRVVDLAERFDVSHVTVTRIVSRLVKEGYLQTEPYRPIVLTEKGAKLAHESQHRHEIVYQFLLSIGVPAGTAAIDAEGIEHHVSPETLARFQAYFENAEKGGQQRSSKASPASSATSARKLMAKRPAAEAGRTGVDKKLRARKSSDSVQ